MKKFRRIFAVLLAITLLVGLLPLENTAEAFTPAHSVIRVGLNGYRSWQVTPTVNLTNTGGLRLGTFNASRQFVPTGNTFTTLRVAGSGANVTVTDGAGATVFTGSSVSIGPVNPSITTTYALPGVNFGDNVRSSFYFHGGFRFTSSGGSLTGINYVNIEDYVRGVVPYESIPSWPLEVLKAQALTARTFAVANFGRRGAHGFDVSNTTWCQVYKGTHLANANTDRAVRDTAGQLILHNGRPIEAVYFSASGGATENVENVWTAPRAYLVGVNDSREQTPSHVQWSRTLTAAQLHTHMRNRDSAFNLPDIANVIPNYTAMGNMYSVTFVASNGATRTYSRGAARTAILGGLSNFTSQRFRITSNARLAPQELYDDIYFTPDVTEDDLHLFPADDLHLFHSEMELWAMAEAGLLEDPEESLPVEPATAGLTFTISNYGFGHNVGMSQWGSNSLARLGYTYDQIIRFYYTGVTISGHSGSITQPDPPGGPVPFIDVPANAWFYEPVNYVREQGLMLGTSHNTFEPTLTATRGMFVTILGRMAEINSLEFAPRATVTGSVVNFRSGPSTSHAVLRQVNAGTQARVVGQSGDWFRLNIGGQIGYIRYDLLSLEWTWHDVAPGAFYAPYVAWARSAGVTTGTGLDVFSPGQTLSRQEMATFLHRYTIAMEITLPQDTSLPLFQDIGTVAEWARDAVIALQRANIVRGTGDGSFEPLGLSDRASVASMIANFHQLHG